MFTALCVFTPIRNTVNATSVVLYTENFDENWGPYGDHPPSDWTIETNEPSPILWDTNNWHRYQITGTNYCARIYYSPVRAQNDSLISPSINCVGRHNIHLLFNSSYYYYSMASHGMVEISINGGPWSLLTDFHSTHSSTHWDFPISSYADNKPDVRIRFHYVDYDGYYWRIDDFQIIAEKLNSTKWEQLPDTHDTGVDIMACPDFAQSNRTLADDFVCNTTGPITDVHLWGSWVNDTKGTITKIHLSIHADIPANITPSHPGELLWQRDFYPGDFTEKLYINNTQYEWWWDPYTNTVYQHGDHTIWQLDVIIPPKNAFIQNGTAQNPVIYWLDVYVEATGGRFGWKTSWQHWNDDAVMYTPGNNPPWHELCYPIGHPYANQSIDMAFQITTSPHECCFGITWPTYGQTVIATRFQMLLNELCDENHTNVSWSITITNNGLGPIRCIPPWLPLNPGFSRTYSSNILYVAAGSSTTRYSPLLWAAIWIQPHITEPRTITITIKIDDCPPETQTATLSWTPGTMPRITIP